MVIIRKYTPVEYKNKAVSSLIGGLKQFKNFPEYLEGKQEMNSSQDTILSKNLFSKEILNL